MLMARSGQETLLKHPSTTTLLNLKWRFIPRLAFYTNLLLYLLFLVLLSAYSIGLTRIAARQTNKFRSVTYNESMEYYYEDNASDPADENITGMGENQVLRGFLISVIFLNLIKKLFQMVLVDGLAFFSSIQNIGECVSLVLALVAVFSPRSETKLNASSITVLMSFIVFSFLIQKLKMFGLYVLAFKRTVQNSTKFFPIFFLIYMGFTLSFNIRTYFGVTYFNSTAGYSLVRALSMALSNLENEEMGLSHPFVINYIIYFMFIGLVCIITFNLFVGKLNNFKLSIFIVK
jgi:hypothetical protein